LTLALLLRPAELPAIHLRNDLMKKCCVLFVILCWFPLRSQAEWKQLDVEWQTSLPEVGQSDVCVQGDHIYLVSFAPLPEGTNDNNSGKPLKAHGVVGQCFDKNDGKLLWEVSMSQEGDPAAATLGLWRDPTSLSPVATDTHVVFYNTLGTLLCCDPLGKEIWRRDFNVPASGGNPQVNGRMYLHDGQLIVALPAPNSSKNRPYYQLHAIDLSNGKDIWVSPALQSMASHYRPVKWEGKNVMLCTLLNRSHIKFNEPNQVFAVSLADGSVVQTFSAPDVSVHQKLMTDDRHWILCGTWKNVDAPDESAKPYVGYFNPKTGECVRRIVFAPSEDVQYFRHGADGYEEAAYVPAFADKGKPYGTRNRPMAGSIHIHEGKVFYLTYSGNALGCIDAETGHTQIVELPLQVIKDKTVWDRREVNLFGGIRNSNGTLFRSEKFGNGRSRQTPSMGGFGHGIPPLPVRYGDTLYWQMGLGMIYMLDLTGDFTPEKVSWAALSQTELHWCYGALAVDDAGIYARSHKQLIKLSLPQNSQFERE
jgi:outer membrane protein assembly factor BamB